MKLKIDSMLVGSAKEQNEAHERRVVLITLAALFPTKEVTLIKVVPPECDFCGCQNDEIMDVQFVDWLNANACQGCLR